MIREFWDKLDKKQRYYILGGAMLLLAVLILEFGIFPFWEARARIKNAMQTNQKRLNEIVKLDTQFTLQDARIAGIKNILAARGPDFSLFSYLEKKAAEAGVKGNIKNMNSARGLQTANYEESLIDVRLDKITIKQLTDFLYYAESPSDLVKIKRITVSKMKESPEYLSCQLQAASFQILNPHPAGR